jgi:hypothetical protein
MTPRASGPRRAKHARYTQQQLDDALGHRLARKNTRKGSAARSAVYAAEYHFRIERGAGLLFSRGQARGHPGKGEQSLSNVTYEFRDVTTTTGIADLEFTSSVVARRVGQYERDVRGLLDGDIEPAAFHRRWTHRIRAAGEHELESDPEAVLALRFEAGPGPVQRYVRRENGVEVLS